MNEQNAQYYHLLCLASDFNDIILYESVLIFIKDKTINEREILFQNCNKTKLKHNWRLRFSALANDDTSFLHFKHVMTGKNPTDRDR
ncbi:hypothetical protein T11_16101 [Trichinella zimbabwensis]|uniref:Uncharacterized protein n=1 Tax=Trichinella zimbabwensis TaxID=268475 RepID=A0A0V1H6S3_9BILA|nr:hypothetical protein T11_16101 [Trichinella zimbabwensis]